MNPLTSAPAIRLDQTIPTQNEFKNSADQQLLQRLAEGDTAAFWELWEHYRQNSFARHCLRWMAGNHEEAEDALSSAGLKAFEYLTTHDVEITNLKHWLQRLLYNHCMDIQRRQKKRLGLALDSNALPATGEPALTPAWNTPEYSLVRSEIRQALRNAIDALPARLREPARRRFLFDMSNQDIALDLDLCPANVRKRLQHARAQLKLTLKTYLADDSDPDGPYPSPPAAAPAMTADPEPAPAVSPELTAHYVALRVVHVKTSNGIEHYIPIALEQWPTRQRQKLSTLRDYVAKHPTGWKRHLALADLLYLAGNWEEAIPLYRHALAKQPRYLSAWVRLAKMLQHLHRTPEAIATYQEALPGAQSVATHHHLNGLILVGQQQPDAAAAAFETARELEPDNPVHGHALGQAQLQAGQARQALNAYDAVLDLQPNDPVALTYSYDALHALGRTMEAHQRVVRALEVDPKNGLALQRQIEYRLDQGLVHGKAGNHTRTLLRRAQRLAPNTPTMQQLMARFYIEQATEQPSPEVVPPTPARGLPHPKLRTRPRLIIPLGGNRKGVWITVSEAEAAGEALRAVAASPRWARP